MLTRIEDFSIIFVPHFLGRGHVRLEIGKKSWEWTDWRLTSEEFNQFLGESIITPFRFEVDNRIYWFFDEKLYKDNEGLTQEDVKALLITRKKQRQTRINRARTIAVSPTVTPPYGSRTIPDDVKLLVWQRDRGRCVKCGSNIELQFDHIIPLSMGGASTPENLQILCGRCNRAKGNSII